MEFTIRLSDVAWFILFLIGVFAGVYLIIVLHRLACILKRSQRLLEDNSDNIDDTLVLLPDVMDNINEITISMKDGVTKAESAIDSIGGTLSEAVVTATSSIDNIAVYTKIAGGVVQTIMDIFSSLRKKKR